MKIILRENPLLLRGDLSYAESALSQIIDEETCRLIKKYGIDRHELILIDAKPLSAFKAENKSVALLKAILKGKRVYFSRLVMKGDCFEFTPPEQVTFEIENPECKKLQRINKKFQKKQKKAAFSKSHLVKINNYLSRINKEVVRNLILAAKRDFDFIIHFNTEMFHHNITAKGHLFTKETVNGIYEDERYTKIINLSDPRERMGFISLYAIAFYGLNLSDLYSVDGIFSLETQDAAGANREADEKKRLAGSEVFNLVFNENRDEIYKKALAMTTALKNLPLPEININLNNLIKKNYPLYCGVSDIGRVFSKLVLSADKEFEDAVKVARRLSYYKLLEKLFDEALKNNENYENTEIYKKVAAFTVAASGKSTAGELNFGVKTGVF